MRWVLPLLAVAGCTPYEGVTTTKGCQEIVSNLVHADSYWLRCEPDQRLLVENVAGVPLGVCRCRQPAWRIDGGTP